MTLTRNVIVCATDFSSHATAAVTWAASLAKRCRAELELVTVLAPPTLSFPELATDAGIFEQAMREQAAARLRQLARVLGEEHGLVVTVQLLEGDPARAITSHAEGAGAQFLVLGTHAHGTVERWLLGSVADRSVRLTHLPVVVVPPTATRLAAGEPEGGRAPRILVGLTDGLAAPGVIAMARAMRMHGPCDLTFVHLYWPIVEYQRLGLAGSRDLFRPDPDVVGNLEPVLREQIGMLPGQGEVSLSIRPAWGDPAAGLLVAAEEGDSHGDAFDVMIVGAEQRHGLARLAQPSVSGKLVRGQATLPVICVPAPRDGAVLPDAPAEAPRLSTVLVPTDLSPAGNAAIPYAYALLRPQGGVVELCHVHEMTLPNPPYAYETRRGRLGAEETEALKAQLRALIPPFAAPLGITTHVSVIEGEKPAIAIVQAAERLRVDAISLGSHGRGGVARAIMGSVAAHVVENSRKPVLVVPRWGKLRGTPG
ncbi:MAG TPA: universal stress protein [Polyangia bacterium]|jgi:nucleotide-binding universal stress UspA family protein|nr:universal stress protein [Polyangia bacterium]